MRFPQIEIDFYFTRFFGKSIGDEYRANYDPSITDFVHLKSIYAMMMVFKLIEMERNGMCSAAQCAGSYHPLAWNVMFDGAEMHLFHLYMHNLKCGSQTT